MPRRLLYDDSLGYTGLESRTDHIGRMSFHHMGSTNKKNELVRFRHKISSGKLDKDRFDYERKAKKQIYDTKLEYVQMLAYKQVYIKNSFTNRHISQPSSDQSATQNYSYGKQPRVRKHLLEKTEVQELKPAELPGIQLLKGRTFHSSTRDRLDAQAEARRSRSAIDVAGAGALRAAPSTERSEFPDSESPTSTADTDQQMEPTLPMVQVHHSAEPSPQQLQARSTQQHAPPALPSRSLTITGSKRVAEDPHKLRSKFMPQECSSFFSMRSFLEDEVKKVINYWSPTSVRKRRTDTILQSVAVPDIIDRQRTTSAILRDYCQRKQSVHSPRSGRRGTVRVVPPQQQRLSSEKEVSDYMQHLQRLVHRDDRPKSGPRRHESSVPLAVGGRTHGSALKHLTVSKAVSALTRSSTMAA